MATATMERPAASSIPKWQADPVLSVEHLTMRFGGLLAVDDLSFDVGRGDITALIGPNGAGKTTVFNCVTGFYKPTEGRIVMRHGEGRMGELVDRITATGNQFGHEDNRVAFLLERMPDFQISDRAKVARTFQNIRLFGGMTVLENLLVAQHNPLMVASGYTFGGVIGLPGYSHAEAEAKDFAAWWLEQVHLIDRADDPAADLPYGAQRRLEIARAMCTRPHLLCLDEPAAGLNPRESAELNALLQFIRAEQDTSVLLIEHDMGVVMEISDHIIVLDYGEMISDGDPDSVRNDPKVIAAYLGVDDEAEIDIPEVLEDIPHPGAKPKKTARAKTAASGAGSGRKRATSAAPKRAAAAGKPAAKTTGGPTKPKAARKPAQPDDLKKISGVGPKIEGTLNELGIWKYAQIAEWKKAERDWVDEHLKFKGRIERDGWVRQAGSLAKSASTSGTASKARPSTRAGRKK